MPHSKSDTPGKQVRVGGPWLSKSAVAGMAGLGVVVLYLGYQTAGKVILAGSVVAYLQSEQLLPMPKTLQNDIKHFMDNYGFPMNSF